MTENASQFIGDIPANYDACLGPILFDDYATDVAARAGDLRPSRVLELAAGTGIVSRMLRDAIPADAKLMVTDLNIPMLDIARGKFDENEAVEFAAADAMSLNFPEDGFDLVVCQFGVMFFPDKQASFREALRVLRAEGTYLFNTWGSWDENPCMRVAHDTVAQFFPDGPPGFYRVPFSYPDLKIVSDDLAAAGFSTIDCFELPIQKDIGDWVAFSRGIVFGNPLIDEIRNRGSVQPEDVADAITAAFRQQFGAEPTSMPLKATVFQASTS
jgi:ubiquinone/menaquinone biosynthesis C-methylase UbiE